MQQIRIIELPRMKVVKSGPIRTEQAFNAFNKWFSDYHAALPCELSPRDFMWYNERKQATEWVYALPAPLASMPWPSARMQIWMRLRTG